MKRKRMIFVWDRFLVLVVIGALFTMPASAEPNWVRKPVTAEWTWFEDYVYLWATYTVVCSPGCTCQAGTGLMAFGKPRGEKMRFSSPTELLVVGAGSIHIRSVDGATACSAAMAPGKMGVIPLVDLKW